MKKIMVALLSVILIGMIFCIPFMLRKQRSYTKLAYEKAALENPLRGLVYADQTELPQSLIFYLIPFRDFYDQDDNLNFDIFEKNLADKTKFGCQAVIRIFISYRGDENESFTGLYMPPHMYENLNGRGKIFSETNESGIKAEFPDYGDEYFLGELTAFIQQFGSLYNNDPRIGFIQLGLIGNWGEWNFFPFHEQVTLTEEKYNMIYQAYEDAFPTTKLMARNPLCGDAGNYKIGFHDDNYLYNTVSLEPVTEENINQIAQFQYMMEKSGTWDKWKTEAYGGELSGATDKLFYEGEGFEYYKKSIEIFHFSHLSLPIPENPPEEHDKALEATRLMGYEFTVSKASLIKKKNNLNVSILLTNTGYAPFYYNWDFEIRIVDKNGEVNAVYPLKGYRITDILPKDSKIFTFILEDVNIRNCDVQFSIVSPMRDIAGEHYKPLYLANADQRGSGFISLGYIK